MGFTPQQVDLMSIWQFTACLEGWQRAKGEKPEAGGIPMDETRARALGLEGF